MSDRWEIDPEKLKYVETANSPEYHMFVIRKSINILKDMLVEKRANRWNESMEVAKDLVYSIAKIELKLLEVEITKVRRIVITGDGFEKVRVGFKKALRLKLKMTGYNLAGVPFNTNPVSLGEFDQVDLKLYDGFQK